MKTTYTYEGEARNKTRFTFVDWLLLLLSAALVISAGAYFVRRRRAVQPTQTIRYTVAVSNVSVALAEVNGGWETLIAKGDRVTSANGTTVLGRVEKIEVRPAQIAGVREGALVWLDALDTVDLLVDVVGEGISQSGDGIRIRDIRIAAGSTGAFRIGGFYAERATVIFVESEKKT